MVVCDLMLKFKKNEHIGLHFYSGGTWITLFDSCLEIFGVFLSLKQIPRYYRYVG
jgi:hypothetical protein